jgi:hypothetical protein
MNPFTGGPAEHDVNTGIRTLNLEQRIDYVWSSPRLRVTLSIGLDGSPIHPMRRVDAGPAIGM